MRLIGCFLDLWPESFVVDHVPALPACRIPEALAGLPINNSRLPSFPTNFILSNHLVPEMRVVNATPPSTPEPGAAWPEFRHIPVTDEVETSWNSPEADALAGRTARTALQISGPFRPDSSHSDLPPSNAARELGTDLNNGQWKLGCVLADQIESSKSKWYTAKLEPGIVVGGKSNDGDSYEVAVHTSYLPWLSFHELDLDLDYNPTTPTNEDKSIHSVWEARRRAQAHFLGNAVNAIRSKCGRGHGECYRDVARSNGLEIPLQREILKHDILVSSSLVSLYIPLTRCSRNLVPNFADALRNGLCCSA